MIFYQFPPLPDEHIYSWLTRLYWLSGFPDFNSFQRSLGLSEKLLKPNKVFESSIISVARLAVANGRIEGTLGNHTPFSFWSIAVPQLSNLNEALIEQAAQNNRHMNEQLVFNSDGSWLSCRQCREEDFNRYGVSYWHMSHQLTSVACCAQHGQRLEFSVDPVKNLFTGVLPHHVRDWCKVRRESCRSIDCWEAFVLEVSRLCGANQSFATSVFERIDNYLGLEQHNLSRLKRECDALTPEFESAVKGSILRHVFRSYAKDQKDNLLYKLFSKQNTRLKVRNPVFILVVAYWLRQEIGLL